MDEFEYDVVFETRTIGIELRATEDQRNARVFRCVSETAKENVDANAVIVKINNESCVNLGYDNVKKKIIETAKFPPITLTFRIKMHQTSVGLNDRRGILKIKVVAAMQLKSRASYAQIEV